MNSKKRKITKENNDKEQRVKEYTKPEARLVAGAIREVAEEIEQEAMKAPSASTKLMEPITHAKLIGTLQRIASEILKRCEE